MALPVEEVATLPETLTGERFPRSRVTTVESEPRALGPPVAEVLALSVLLVRVVRGVLVALELPLQSRDLR
jgi:hypothetical protein